MEYFSFQRFFAFLWGVEVVSVLEIHCYEQINNGIVHNISIQHTNEYAAIWQRDNKNSNHSLIEENAEIIVFEPLRFILLLNANLLPQK